jgi:hypothetical protein
VEITEQELWYSQVTVGLYLTSNINKNGNIKWNKLVIIIKSTIVSSFGIKNFIMGFEQLHSAMDTFSTGIDLIYTYIEYELV